MLIWKIKPGLQRKLALNKIVNNLKEVSKSSTLNYLNIIW